VLRECLLDPGKVDRRLLQHSVHQRPQRAAAGLMKLIDSRSPLDVRRTFINWDAMSNGVSSYQSQYHTSNVPP